MLIILAFTDNIFFIVIGHGWYGNLWGKHKNEIHCQVIADNLPNFF